MVARRSTLISASVLFALAVSLVLLAGSASAALTHSLASSFDKGSFIESVALDGSGDVYVYDASGSIRKFDASGSPVSFSSTGTNAIEGVEFNGGGQGQVAVDTSGGVGKGDIYVATSGRVSIFAPSGEALGELNGNIESEVLATQGMWGAPCGVATDGQGDVYVGLTSGHVFKYVPSANPVVNTDYSTSLNGLESVCEIAVDSTGSVYTTTWNGGPVHKYDALQFGVLAASGGLVSELGIGVAVDASNDDVYVDQENHVVQYSDTGEQLTVSNGGEESIENSYGVAATAGTVYVVDNSPRRATYRVDVLGTAAIVPDVTLGQATGVSTTSETLQGTVNPDGEPVTSCRFEYGNAMSVPCSPDPGSGSEPVEVSATVIGLSANTSYGFRLVAESANGKSVTQGGEFTTLSPPLIQSESPRDVSYESASIEAQINPMGSASTYHVEYGLDTSYGARAPVSTEATLGSGNEYVTVKQALSGLQAGTTYHFRVVATNANDTTDGQDYTLRTPASVVAVADGCPNAAIRAVQHASLLPECRGYEMASPVEKGGGDIAAFPRHTQSAVDGNSIKFYSKTAFGDAIGSESPGAEYIAKRDADGWATHSINPEQDSVFDSTLTPSTYMALSPDLTKGVFFGRTPVLPGYPNVEHLENLYLRTDLQSPGAGHYELLSDAVAPVAPLPGESVDMTITVDGASADWSHILFESVNNLTADTSTMDTKAPKLYEWHDGVVTFAGILPDSACESPPCLAPESIAGRGAGAHKPYLGGGKREREYPEDWTTNSISADGSRIVFEAGGLEREALSELNFNGTYGDLYMRIDKTSTVQLNASERSTPDPRGHQPARFLAATADDSKVFFESSELLTDAEGSQLYMYEVQAPPGKHLTAIGNGTGGTSVVSTPWPAISEDGSFIYFLSTQRLTADAPSLSGATEMYLYVWHDGVVRFVVLHTGHGGPVSGLAPEPKWGDESNTGASLSIDEFRMSADGRKIAFASDGPTDAQQAGVRPDGHDEVYVYDYDTGKLSCASCDPAGTLATGDATIEGRADSQSFTANTQYLGNAMSSDGRYVFFDTGDPLVAQDTNGRRDVYEYDTVTGEVHLLSGGSCDCDSTFADASPDGSNVFFTTRQRLVRMDVDENSDMYDARIDGGIPAQNEASSAACDGEECRGPAGGAPVFSTPSSASFAGAGNPAPVTRKVQVKRKRPTLAQALRACKHKPKKQRAKCRVRARKAYHANRATRVQASRRAGR